ncbi:hypothetical protein NKI36_00925 [Mesorhizobium caraganae]|uniref:Uncharacterized protein n=1 Tax=Mesorhizobium caraganae TaxID=483206 RepID=A0ABV1YSB2_9HYPH
MSEFKLRYMWAAALIGLLPVDPAAGHLYGGGTGSDPEGFISALQMSGRIERRFFYCSIDLKIDGNLSGDNCHYTMNKLAQISKIFDSGPIEETDFKLMRKLIEIIGNLEGIDVTRRNKP